MHRIDQPDATEDNKFTDGNDATGVQATTVDAAWLNGLQESLIQFMESRGIAPEKGNFLKFTEALLNLSVSGSSNKINLANHITIPQVLLTLDKTKVKSANIVIDIERRTDAKEINSEFNLKINYQPGIDRWKWIPSEDFENSGVVFTLNDETGVVSFTTSNMVGGSYEGFLRYKSSVISI